MNLNQITISVASLDRSIAFYQSLGLTLIVHSPGNAYARFECPDGDTTFSLHEAADVEAGASFCFEVADVDATVHALEDKGVIFETPPTDQRWLWREAWTRDPDGNRIAIYHAGENRRFPPWRIKA